MKNLISKISLGIVGTMLFLGTGCTSEKANIPEKETPKTIITCNEGFFCLNDSGVQKIQVPIDINGDLKSDKDLNFLSLSPELEKINKFYRENNHPEYILINYHIENGKVRVDGLEKYSPSE